MGDDQLLGIGYKEELVDVVELSRNETVDLNLRYAFKLSADKRANITE